MKKTLAAAGIVAVAVFLGSAAADAQGKKGTQGANPPMTKAVNEMGDESVKHTEEEAALNSFARADKASGAARTPGANSLASCPPRQKKKLGSGC
jgi:hypothetical protein